MKLFKNLSLSKRIFFSILLLNILAFGLMAILAVVQFKNYSEEYNEDRLERKESRILKEIEYIISPYEPTTETLPKLLRGRINEISDKNSLDINIYNIDGKLILSNFKVDSINPTYLNEAIRKKLQTLNRRIEIDVEVEEKEGVLINSYDYIYDNNMAPIAIIHIPYFHEQKFFESDFFTLIVRILIIMFLFLIGSSVFAWFTSKNIISKIQEVANKIKYTDVVSHNQPLVYDGTDEVKILVDAYNEMLAKLSEQTTLLAKIEREDAWREMAKQVAHEIKNPLTPMRLNIQNFMLNFDKTQPEADEKLKNFSKGLLQQIDTINSITDAFSDFAKMPIKSDDEIDVVEVIQNTLAIFPQENITFECNCKEDIVVAMLDRLYFTRIVTNLLKNAIQSIPDTRKPEIKVIVHNFDDYFELLVQDNGMGIPKDIQNKIFDPKFTTKSSGMGLGLAMVKKIVEDYEGKITFTTQKDLGTEFILSFPKIRK